MTALDKLGKLRDEIAQLADQCGSIVIQSDSRMIELCPPFINEEKVNEINGVFEEIRDKWDSLRDSYMKLLDVSL